jgi:hypothetical protein
MEFVGQVDGEVAAKRPERETGDTLGNGGGCASVAGAGAGVAGAAAVAAGGATAAVLLLLSDVLGRSSAMSQFG